MTRSVTHAALVLALASSTSAPLLAQPATGPILSWTIPTAEAGNVTRWQACLDAACTDVTPAAPVPEGTNNRYKYTYPAPVSPQAHAFRVRACNALTCVDSDDLKVAPPPKPANLALQ